MKTITLLLLCLQVVCFITNVVDGTPITSTANTTNKRSSTEIAKQSASSYTHGHNGRPGCRTAVEIDRPWRNNCDPTSFWFCDELGKDAIEIRCPAGGYMSEHAMCMPWKLWQWEYPVDPPTMA